MTDQVDDGTGNDDTGSEHPTVLRESSPNAGGPDRAAGEMGVSSERVGPTGRRNRGDRWRARHDGACEHRPVG